jgi:hypothetical protein
MVAHPTRRPLSHQGRDPFESRKGGCRLVKAEHDTRAPFAPSLGKDLLRSHLVEPGLDGIDRLRQYPGDAAAAPQIAPDRADLEKLASRMIVDHGHRFDFSRNNDKIAVGIPLDQGASFTVYIPQTPVPSSPISHRLSHMAHSIRSPSFLFRNYTGGRPSSMRWASLSVTSMP